MPTENCTESTEDDVPTEPDHAIPEPFMIDHAQDIDLGPLRHADGNVGQVRYGISALENGIHNSSNAFQNSIVAEYCKIAINALEQLNRYGEFNVRNGPGAMPNYLFIHERLTQIAQANQGSQFPK